MWLDPLPTHLTSATQEHYTVLSLPVTLKDRPPALVRLLLQRSQAAGTQVDPEVEQACQQLVREGRLAACGWDWL